MTTADYQKKREVLAGLLKVCEERWRETNGDLPFPTSYAVASEALALAETLIAGLLKLETAIESYMNQTRPVHLVQGVWEVNRERNSSPVGAGVCPCTHWQAFLCDTCRGACSCHWVQK